MLEMTNTPDATAEERNWIFGPTLSIASITASSGLRRMPAAVSPSAKTGRSLQLAAGIDLHHAFTGDFDFLPAHGRAEREELAIDVALLDIIEVHETQMPDPGARKRFDRVRADPAQPDHRHAGGPEPLHPFFAKQHLGSDESVHFRFVMPNAAIGRN